MLTIIASMEHELAGLRRKLKASRVEAKGDNQAALRQTSPVELHVVGIGGPQCRGKVSALLSRATLDGAPAAGSPRGLLLLGFAGALNPALATGDLVIPPRYYQASEIYQASNGGVVAGTEASEGGYLSPDGEMWRCSLQAASDAGLPITHLDSLTVDGLVSTPAAKAGLCRRYQAGIVAMEDYWMAAAAREAGVPFLAARVVLDPANQSLPPYLPDLARSRRAAVLGVSAGPWRIPTLLALGRQMQQAQRVLTRFALAYTVKHWDANGLSSNPELANASR